MHSSLNTIVQNRSKRTKKAFTAKEDQIIQHFVNIIGSHKWEFIAKFVPGRSAKQCRDRYMNNLKPGLMKIEWDHSEDEQLIDLYEKYGPKWSLFCNYLKNRNQTCIKSRYLFLQKNHLTSSHKKTQESEHSFEKIHKNNEGEQKEKNDDTSDIHVENYFDNLMKKSTQRHDEKVENRKNKEIETNEIKSENFQFMFKSEEFNFSDDLNDDIDLWY